MIWMVIIAFSIDLSVQGTFQLEYIQMLGGIDNKYKKFYAKLSGNRLVNDAEMGIWTDWRLGTLQLVALQCLANNALYLNHKSHKLYFLDHYSQFIFG